MDNHKDAKDIKKKLFKEGPSSLTGFEKIILKFDSDIQAASAANRKMATDINEYKAKTRNVLATIDQNIELEAERRRAWETMQKKKIDELYAREAKRKICKKRRYLPNCKEYKPLLDIILAECREIGFCELKSKDLRVLLMHQTGYSISIDKINRLIEGMIANNDIIKPEKSVYERGIGRKGFIRRLFPGK